MSTRTASGSFEVRLNPQPTDAAPVGRLSINKQFSGDLEGTSKGEMLSFRSGVQGSAGYVALEHFTGTLHGRKGSFALQHSGAMDRGAQSLSITVVPDSGTDELEGLTGTMTLQLEGGGHGYALEYAFNPTN